MDVRSIFTLSSTIELRKFISITGFFVVMIKRYILIAMPITDLYVGL